MKQRSNESGNTLYKHEVTGKLLRYTEVHMDPFIPITSYGPSRKKYSDSVLCTLKKEQENINKNIVKYKKRKDEWDPTEESRQIVPQPR